MSAADAGIYDRWMRWSFIVAGVCVAGLAVGWAMAPSAFYHGYLLAYLLWIGMPLGAGAILMTHHLTGGKWGWSVRGLLVPGVATLPLFALLFVPIAVGLPHLYRWSLSSEVAHDVTLQAKLPYLNAPFFFIRAGVFLITWALGAYWLASWSRRQGMGIPEDDSGEELGDEGLRRLSAGGLVVYAVTVSFAAIDWLGSLQPHWYSSIFGMYILVGQVQLALAVVILVFIVLWWWGGGGAVPDDMLHDLGNLLLVLVIFHAYLAYSQLLIIWSGNLPEQVVWYVPRIRGAWGAVTVALIVIDFILPFAALLFRVVKRSPALLFAVAAVVVFAQGLEAVWLVLPVLPPEATASGPVGGFGRIGFAAALLTVAALLGIGGLWFGTFAWHCRRWAVRVRAVIDAAPGEEHG